MSEIEEIIAKYVAPHEPEKLFVKYDAPDGVLKFGINPDLLAAIAAMVERAREEGAREALEALEAQLPTKFSAEDEDNPGFSGGWHLDTYKLAIEDCRTDINAALAALHPEREGERDE